MNDGEMTATECMRLMARWSRRASLKFALAGSVEMKMIYCIEREFDKEWTDALVFGSAMIEMNEKRLSNVMRNLVRLVKFAEVWNGKQAQAAP